MIKFSKIKLIFILINLKIYHIYYLYLKSIIIISIFSIISNIFTRKIMVSKRMFLLIINLLNLFIHYSISFKFFIIVFYFFLLYISFTLSFKNPFEKSIYKSVLFIISKILFSKWILLLTFLTINPFIISLLKTF